MRSNCGLRIADCGLNSGRKKKLLAILLPLLILCPSCTAEAPKQDPNKDAAPASSAVAGYPPAGTRLVDLPGLRDQGSQSHKTVTIEIQQPKTPSRTEYSASGQVIKQGGTEGWNSTPWNGKTPAELAGATQGMTLTERTPTLGITAEGDLTSAGGGSAATILGQKADNWWDKIVHWARVLWDTLWWGVIILGVLAVAALVLGALPSGAAQTVAKVIWRVVVAPFTLFGAMWSGAKSIWTEHKAGQAVAGAQTQTAQVVAGGDEFKTALATLPAAFQRALTAALPALDAATLQKVADAFAVSAGPDAIWVLFKSSQKAKQDGPTQAAVDALRSA